MTVPPHSPALDKPLRSMAEAFSDRQVAKAKAQGASDFVCEIIRLVGSVSDKTGKVPLLESDILPEALKGRVDAARSTQ